jgi:hypothetical protein
VEPPFGARVPRSRLRATWLCPFRRVLFCDEPGGVGGEGLGGDAAEASDPDGVDLAIFEERVDGGAADGKPPGRLDTFTS